MNKGQPQPPPLFSPESRMIHEERCRDDVMYALLHNVEPDISDFLEECLNLIVKKNSPDLEHSIMFREARKFLSSDASVGGRLFFLLFIINKEPEVQDLLRRRAAASESLPGNLWGAHAVQHLDDFLQQHLSKMVEATLNWPCSTRNIVDVVRNFSNAARSTYLTQ
jgi:hypothetical protein